jgi:hypothetical protein
VVTGVTARGVGAANADVASPVADMRLAVSSVLIVFIVVS